jgi:hypothetical protein
VLFAGVLHFNIPVLLRRVGFALRSRLLQLDDMDFIAFAFDIGVLLLPRFLNVCRKDIPTDILIVII